MNKSELIVAMAEKSGMTKKDCAVALDAFVISVKDAMVNGDKVSIPGLGIFSTKTRQARAGRNPKTGEAMEIPASTTPVFKAAKPMKDCLNEK